MTQDLVIIGASMTGLFTAAAAHSAGWQASLIDSDELPASAQQRPGVPQNEPDHVLRQHCLLSVEQLLPGLVELGAPSFQSGLFSLLSDDGCVSTGEQRFELVCVSHSLLKHVVC